MKKILIAALLASQTAPAVAAGFAPARDIEAGAFAGMRLRVPLDGAEPQRRIRAGLTVAPAIQTRDLQGDRRTVVGEGLELGMVGGEPVSLSIAGTPVSRLVAGGDTPHGRRAGVSTVGWVAIGVGTVLVVGLAAGYLWLDDALECNPGDDCS